MRKFIALIAVGLSALTLGACGPWTTKFPVISQPIPTTTTTLSVQKAIAVDPVLKWKCHTLPAPGYVFYTNDKGYAELPPALRKTCVRIPPVAVTP